MGFDLKMQNHLECADGEEVTIHSVGDNVVCETGGKRYLGKIASIGYYRKEKDSDPQPAIYIDTSKNKTSYSGEIILVDDITYLYNDSVTYKQEAVQNLIDLVLDYRDNMTEQDRNKVGKLLMGLWQTSKQEK